MPTLETIYLIHHSHTDIGYTHDQPVLWEMERRFIDAAIDSCEQHLDHDGPHAFRWVVETLAQLQYWLEHSSDAQIDRFLKLERAKRIEVMGMFANITPLMDTAELVELFQPIRRYREQYGLTIRHGMNCDVNGQNWGLVDVLLDAGIEGFSMAINQHAGGAPLQRPNIFRWEGPTGRQIPTFNGWVYAVGDDMKIGRDMEVWRTKWLPWLRQKLQDVKWPMPFFPMQTYHPFGDNGSANYHLSQFIQDWNARGEGPIIRLSTYADFWDAARTYADKFDVHRGDWTDYWNFGSISSAREVAINRNSRARLVGADKLYSVLSPLGVRPGATTGAAGGMPAQEPGRDPGLTLGAAPAYRDKAWWSLYLWDEHTWGADVAVSQPDNEDTAAQWNHKAQYAYQARSLSMLLQRDGIGELALLIPRSADDALIVFNPLPWKRTLTGPVPDAVANPRGFGDDPSASRHHQDRMRAGRRWWVNGVEVPAFGYAVVKRDQLLALDSEARDIFQKQLVEASQPYTEHEVVENDHLKLTFDREHGGVRSWIYKRLGREIIDQTSQWQFGGIVYERLADLQHPSPRRLLYDPVDSVRELRGWRTERRLERWGASRLISHKVFALPGGVQVVQVVEIDGLPSPVTYRIFIADNSPAVDFQAEWTMGLNVRPEATYIAMPFAVDGATARIDLGGQAVQLDKDQIPGACRDYFTVQSWTDLSSAEWGVTVASPDNPMIQLDDFHFGHDQRTFTLDHALYLGWVTNNYWETNFRAHQPGRVSAHYVVQPHAGGFDESAAHRFGSEVCAPPIWQSAFEPARAGAALPTSANLLVLPELPVVVLDVLPGWAQHDSDPNAVYVRLLNASDKNQLARIGSALLKITGAQACDLFGKAGKDLTVTGGAVSVSIAPRYTAVVRLSVAQA